MKRVVNKFGVIVTSLIVSLCMGAEVKKGEVPFSGIESWLKKQPAVMSRGAGDIVLEKALIVHTINRRELREGKVTESLGTANFSKSRALYQTLSRVGGGLVDTLIDVDQVHYFHYSTKSAASVVATLAWLEEQNRDLDIRIVKNGGFVRPWSRTEQGILTRKSDNSSESGVSVERVDSEIKGGDEFVVQISLKDGVTDPCAYKLLISGGEFSQRQKRQPKALASTIKREYDARARVENYAEENGVAIDTFFEDGRKRTIIDIKDGKPLYYQTYNVNAGKSSETQKLWPGGDLGLDLTGSGLPRSIGIWDGGAVLATHQEFGGRVKLGDNVATNNHASHVAGTMIASGVNPAAKGMAYEAKLVSYDWNNDLSQMRSEASNGLVISQHSYGMPKDYSYSPDWDNVAYDHPFYTISKSAANDGKMGSSTITLHGNSKNIITVGSAHDQPNGWTGPNITISDFSSRGPTPDYRIKPDILANGQDVFSTTDTSNTKYETMSGTSMSGPAHAGSVALLHEHYYNTHGNTFLRSASMRGLVIHTSDEVGAEGPDYNSGWGYLNTKRAAQLITNNEGGDAALIQELSLTNSETFSLVTTAKDGEDITVTVCWNDPVSSATGSRRQLVNDLDLRVIVDGTEHMPWAMNTQTSQALRGDNDRDNVEKVTIGNVNGSSVEIVVSHKGSLNTTQEFSLLMSGVVVYTDPYLKLRTPNGGEEFEQFSTQTIRWGSNVDEPVDVILLKGGTPVDTLAAAIPNSGKFEWQIPEDMEIGSDYSIKVASINTDSLKDESDANFSVIRENLIIDFPFIETFDSYTSETDVVGKWEQRSDDDMNWLLLQGATPSKLHPQGGGTGPDGDHSGSGNYLYVEATSNFGNNTVIETPMFSLQNLLNPKLIFWVHMFSRDGNMGDFALHAVVDGVEHRDILTLNGDHGDMWFKQEVDLTPYKGKRVKLIFGGTAGTNYDSDICIDDIGIDGEVLPEYTDLSDITTKEGVPFEAEIAVNNPGNSVDVSLTLNGAPSWLKIKKRSNSRFILSGTARAGTAGSSKAKVKMFAGNANREDEISIIVEPNSAPTFVDKENDTIDVDHQFTTRVTLEDIDPENYLSISSNSLPAWLTLSDNGDGTADLSGTPKKGDEGDLSILLWGSDGVVIEPVEYQYGIRVLSSSALISAKSKEMVQSKLIITPSIVNGSGSSVQIVVKADIGTEYMLSVKDALGNSVYQQEGRTVATDLSAKLSLCSTWSGVNSSGREVGSGTYSVFVITTNKCGASKLFKGVVGVKR